MNMALGNATLYTKQLHFINHSCPIDDHLLTLQQVHNLAMHFSGAIIMADFNFIQFPELDALYKGEYGLIDVGHLGKAL